MDPRDREMSKFLSLVLRHRPESIGITLDPNGWTDIATLLDALARIGKPLSMRALEKAVETGDKRRFAFNADRSRIRAFQGHSVAVDLGLGAAIPPHILYHGTARRFLASILREGLSKRQRHHVHLHADHTVAVTVGARRGEVSLLSIDASAMHGRGYKFYVTENDVWLTDSVPPEFIIPV
jgi:putative RNA 2'-phosphotransferase